MTDPDLPNAALITASLLLGRRVGLQFDSAARGRLARCVVDEARNHELDVDAYVARLPGDAPLLQALVDGVTVQESSFFRDPVQLEVFRNHVLPGHAGPLRVWSAGCANGQEPYTLAMILAESTVSDWQVTATDVSKPAVEYTRRGLYTARQLTGISPERRDRHFRPVGAGWEIAAPLRERVWVLHHNLFTDPPPIEAGSCQVVFCRNVLIYIRQDTMVAFLERLAGWLPPAGWLFLGYSESLWQVTDVFRLVRLGDGFVYRLPGAAAENHPAGSRSEAPELAVPQGPARPRRPGPRLPPGIGVPSRAVPPEVGVPARGLPPGAGMPGHGRNPPARRARLGRSSAGGAMEVLLAQGEAALNRGEPATAVALFRKCTYLESEHVMAHLHLAFALEAIGDQVAARRAYAATRAAIGRAGAGLEPTLHGYDVVELWRLLESKLLRAEPPS